LIFYGLLIAADEPVLGFKMMNQLGCKLIPLGDLLAGNLIAVAILLKASDHHLDLLIIQRFLMICYLIFEGDFF
jgi:hypothetical protein